MVEQDAWFGNFVATALVMQQSTSSTEIFHTILLTNLINNVSFENIDIQYYGTDLMYIEYYADRNRP